MNEWVSTRVKFSFINIDEILFEQGWLTLPSRRGIRVWGALLEVAVALGRIGLPLTLYRDSPVFGRRRTVFFESGCTCRDNDTFKHRCTILRCLLKIYTRWLIKRFFFLYKIKKKHVFCVKHDWKKNYNTLPTYIENWRKKNIYLQNIPIG